MPRYKELDKKFNYKEIESRIYEMWEKSGVFTPKINKNIKPFTILLPPPNASGKMHTGNILMIAIEDVLIRWKRMQGFNALWIPGTDHAGFETQTTYERLLKKEGKSRFDFDRDTLYQKIWDFVHENKKNIENQMRIMGASVDWTRYKFTLDKDVLNVVYSTFERLYKDGLVYRDDYIVNYSPYWGTTFSDAEIQYVERKDPLYYLKYGPFVLATVRPETKFGDTAVAVNPNDDRYKDYIGKDITFEGLLGPVKLKVIADTYVDMSFGTGVVKITPAHDKNDYEVGIRHNLDVVSIIDLNGRLNSKAGRFSGMKVLEARKAIVAELEEKGLIEKIDNDYTHLVPVDYRAGHDIENLVLPNWFIKVDTLKEPAYEAVKSGKVQIYPKWREITYLRWMEGMRDWPISRQTVWGIRIPFWYDTTKNPDLQVTFIKDGTVFSGKISELLKENSITAIKTGLQKMIVPKNSTPVFSVESPGDNYIQETDTFDTWFSSGQWPVATLGYPDSEDFKYFYPTDVLETGWEIITRWVSRMIMFGMYLTNGTPPFKNVYLHGTVKAPDGRKMSKSLGNVINPEEYIEEFGVDALRMGLISGTANGKDFSFPKDRVLAYRNFSNKLWNMTRFMMMMFEEYYSRSNKEPPFYNGTTFSSSSGVILDLRLSGDDEVILSGLKSSVELVQENLEKFRFADAADTIYQFVWKEVADKYIEQVKKRDDKDVALAVLRYTLLTCLKLLHPFMPFVTEEIWNHIPKESENTLLVAEKWPTTH